MFKLYNDYMEELNSIYEKIKDKIDKRISEFDLLKSSNNDRAILKEMVFCLMTPQSKAKVCAEAADNLFDKDRVFDLTALEISDIIRTVRFKNNKAAYIKEAIDKFKCINILEIIYDIGDIYKTRGWFVDNIKGFGYKEASHFLRNIGFGYELAILDRHILKNLNLYSVIDEIPKSISPKRYINIEARMQEFSNKINIPMHHLDFLFWYKQTNEVFK